MSALNPIAAWDALKTQARLSSLQRAVCNVLISEPARVWSQAEIIAAVYGNGIRPEAKIIDVTICKTRKKIAKATNNLASPIFTVWGKGYTLDQSKVQ